MTFFNYFNWIVFYTRKYIQVPNSKIDVGFGHLDKNADGVVDPEEFARLILTDDKDGNLLLSVE